jgi:hypothetical protein
MEILSETLLKGKIRQNLPFIGTFMQVFAGVF